MSPEQARELIRLADHPRVIEASRQLQAGTEPLSIRAFLEAEFPPESCRAVLDALTTRQHFSHKFEDSQRWLLQRTAAEQATASILASWRSAYLKDRFPTVGEITELGTGIGGDSVYLARHFALRGYEQDAGRALLACANVANLSPGGRCSIDDQAAVVAQLSGDLLFADPARRGETRKFDPESWDPPLSALLEHGGFKAKVIKTAPGLDLQAVPLGAEVHFLSLAGELKEAMLLMAPEDEDPDSAIDAKASRHAWLWEKGSSAPLHRWGEPAPVEVRAPRVGDFLHDPDPSVGRAGLLAQLAGELEAGVVHPKIGYLCGPRPNLDGWAASFAIAQSFPLQWKAVNKAIAASDWSDFEYLSRGVPFSQADVLERTKSARKVMKGRPGGRGSIVIYRDREGYRALLARRVDRH